MERARAVREGDVQSFITVNGNKCPEILGNVFVELVAYHDFFNALGQTYVIPKV